MIKLRVQEDRYIRIQNNCDGDHALQSQLQSALCQGEKSCRPYLHNQNVACMEIRIHTFLHILSVIQKTWTLTKKLQLNGRHIFPPMGTLSTGIDFICLFDLPIELEIFVSTKENFRVLKKTRASQLSLCNHKVIVSSFLKFSELRQQNPNS